jgi:hypothetical protein
MNKLKMDKLTGLKINDKTSVKEDIVENDEVLELEFV